MKYAILISLCLFLGSCIGNNNLQNPETNTGTDIIWTEEFNNSTRSVDWYDSDVENTLKSTLSDTIGWTISSTGTTETEQIQWWQFNQ